MNSGHYINKCRVHGAIVGQCRCPEEFENKNKRMVLVGCQKGCPEWDRNKDEEQTNGRLTEAQLDVALEQAGMLTQQYPSPSDGSEGRLETHAASTIVRLVKQIRSMEKPTVGVLESPRPDTHNAQRVVSSPGMSDGCGICGGRLIPISVLRWHEIGRLSAPERHISAVVQDDFSICVDCQTELYTPDQMQAVMDRVREATSQQPAPKPCWEVMDFARAMDTKLETNRALKNQTWLRMTPNHLFDHLEEEIIELRDAIENGDPQFIREECADVGNFAMMIFDVTREKGTR